MEVGVLGKTRREKDEPTGEGRLRSHQKVTSTIGRNTSPPRRKLSPGTQLIDGQYLTVAAA
jgi:hypothetical protein